MKVLGIETSCDDTGIAIYDEGEGIIANSLYSQTAMHNKYGGIVPELASRDHIRKLLPLMEQALKEAKCKLSDIHAIAYTRGPGLMGALMVGAAFAKGLGYANQLPCIGVHHMEAHLLAPLLEKPAPEFPFIALLVSGGHTLLVLVKQFGDYQILGESVDDAAGEAFDKVAKLLGLPYPGGPAIEKLAEGGDVSRFKFPRPMTDRSGLDFSFSGLKTSVLNIYEKFKNEENCKANIAAGFQIAVIETLLIKCERALKEVGIKSLVVAGGVSANQYLRKRFQKLDESVFYPRYEYCTDNAAMVAYAGFLRIKSGYVDKDFAIQVRARWELAETH